MLHISCSELEPLASRSVDSKLCLGPETSATSVLFRPRTSRAGFDMTLYIMNYVMYTCIIPELSLSMHVCVRFFEVWNEILASAFEFWNLVALDMWLGGWWSWSNPNLERRPTEGRRIAPRIPPGPTCTSTKCNELLNQPEAYFRMAYSNLRWAFYTCIHK